MEARPSRDSTSSPVGYVVSCLDTMTAARAAEDSANKSAHDWSAFRKSKQEVGATRLLFAMAFVDLASGSLAPGEFLDHVVGHVVPILHRW